MLGLLPEKDVPIRDSSLVIQVEFTIHLGRSSSLYHLWSSVPRELEAVIPRVMHILDQIYPMTPFLDLKKEPVNLSFVSTSPSCQASLIHQQVFSPTSPFTFTNEFSSLKLYYGFHVVPERSQGISIRDGNERIKTGSTFYTRVKIHPHPTIISLVDAHDASVVKTKTFMSSPHYILTGELLRR